MVARDLVQVLLPNRTLRASFISPDATVRDVIATLLAEDGPEIVREVVHFQDFDLDGTEGNDELWTMQKVISSEPNRSWTEEELEGLGDGMLFLRYS
jgi:hypothetical protein